VDPHTSGHMYGAAVLALAGLGLTVVIAHAALRRGEVWAWWSLTGFWLLSAGADVFEVFGIYPHDFPLAQTPADGVRGFGWQTLGAWILIWAVGLAVAAPTVLAGKRRPVPVTAGASPWSFGGMAQAGRHSLVPQQTTPSPALPPRFHA